MTPEDIRQKYGIPDGRSDDLFGRGRVTLLAPRAYKMSLLIGEPESQNAILTGWGDPWHVVSENDIEKFAVLGSLRICFGIDLMLHNLARNPQIGNLIVQAGGKNDNTEAGLLPRKILKALWENGVDNNGNVIGANYRLSAELVENGALEVVKATLARVNLVDWSGKPKDKLQEQLDNLPLRVSTDRAIVLPEFKIKEEATWPSERAGMVFRAPDAFSGWLSLLSGIMRYGKDGKLETAGTMVRELEFVRVVVSGEKPFANIPDWATGLKDLAINPESLEQYYQRFFRPESYMQPIHEDFPDVLRFERPANEKYLYAELLWAFSRPEKFDSAVQELAKRNGIEAVADFLKVGRTLTEKQKGVIQMVIKSDISDSKKTEILLEVCVPPTNQVAKAIERLKHSPDDADKTMILWDPSTHGMQDRGRPCLIEVALLERDGKIDAKAVFRSHDIGKGWIFNAVGVSRLLDDICAETGFKRGDMILESESAHVYSGDQNWVGKLWQNQVVDISSSRAFDHTRGDPRGDISISVVNGQIVCRLNDPRTGKPLHEFTGVNHREIITHMNKLNLISHPSHGLDIGIQLMTAELAIKFGLPFTQDRPFETVGAIRDRISVLP